MYRADNVVSLFGPPVPTAFVDVVQIWSVTDVVQWLRGLDDCVLPCIPAVVEAGVDGCRLLMLTQDDLVDMNISSVGVREIIMQGVHLLVNLCYNMENENLQSLAMTLCVRARNLEHEMTAVSALVASMQKLPSASRSRRQIVDLLNRVCVGVSYVAEETKKIVFWLDRSPFDQMRQYVTIRNQIMDLVVSMVKAVNVPSKEMLSSPTKIANNCDQLCSICDHIIEDLDDPLVLYTAYLDRAILRKTKPTCEWGVNLQSSYRGVHVISEVKMQSPADMCGRVDAGDEILQINGQTVIGWDLSKVAQRMAGHRAHELVLLLKKRPRELLTLIGPKSTPGTPQPVSRRAPPRLLPPPSPIDEQPPSGRIVPKKRRRSNSMTTPKTPLLKSPATSPWATDAVVVSGPTREMGLFSPTEKRLPPWELATVEPEPASSLERRATICGGSPLIKRWSRHLTRNSLDPRPHAQWFQPNFAPSNNATEPERTRVVVCRSRTMRGQPDKFVRSLIDNKLVDTEDEDEVFALPDMPAAATDEQEDPLAVDYAHIELADPAELEQLGLPTLSDQFDSPEWKQNRPRLAISSDSSVEGSGSTSVVQLAEDFDVNRPFRIRQPPCRNMVAPLNRSASPSNMSRSLESHQKLKWIFGEDVPTLPVQPTVVHHRTPAMHKQHKMVRDEIAMEGAFVSLTKMRPLPSIFHRTTSEGPPNMMPERRKCESAYDLSPSNELQALSSTPCAALEHKTAEGWVRRRRMINEVGGSSGAGKWLKRWLALRSNVLYIYESPLAIEAEAIVAVSGFTVCDAPEIKSSKRYIFKLVREEWAFFFACYNFEDMKSWMNKLGLATIGYNQTAEERSSSESLSKGYVYFPFACDPCASYQSLPRNTIFGTGPRFRSRKKPAMNGGGLGVNRQGSVTSAHSGHSTDSTGTSKDIFDPLRPKGRRRKPIPTEMLP